MKANLARAGAGKVVCRLCKGDHFTAKCPYKDSLPGLDGADTPPNFGGEDTGTPAEPAAAPTTGGKYVPPSMRAGGGRGPGEAMGRPGGSRDDLPTLRVTNISEDVQENDLRDLFGTFGRVARVYVGRDRETGAGKGFAFVSFEERAVAQRAMEKMHGRGYDNLILNIQWSRKWWSAVVFGCWTLIAIWICRAERTTVNPSYCCVVAYRRHLVMLEAVRSYVQHACLGTTLFYAMLRTKWRADHNLPPCSTHGGLYRS